MKFYFTAYFCYVGAEHIPIHCICTDQASASSKRLRKKSLNGSLLVSQTPNVRYQIVITFAHVKNVSNDSNGMHLSSTGILHTFKNITVICH